MDKKGVELSLNMVIIAIIALLVLVVIVYLLSSGTLSFKRGTACVKAGGRCVPEAECNRLTHDNYGQTLPDGTILCPPSRTCCSLVPRSSNT